MDLDGFAVQARLNPHVRTRSSETLREVCPTRPVAGIHLQVARGEFKDLNFVPGGHNSAPRSKPKGKIHSLQGLMYAGVSRLGSTTLLLSRE